MAPLSHPTSCNYRLSGDVSRASIKDPAMADTTNAPRVPSLTESEQVEVEGEVGNEFTVQDKPLGLQSGEAGGDLREEAVERFLFLGLQINLVAVAISEAAELYVYGGGGHSNGEPQMGRRKKPVGIIALQALRRRDDGDAQDHHPARSYVGCDHYRQLQELHEALLEAIRSITELADGKVVAAKIEKMDRVRV